MHSYYCLIALGRERGKKILQFLMEISQKYSLSVLLSSIVKTVNCIPIQNFPLNKEQHFSLYTSASAAPLCSTLLLSWTWMLSVPYHLLQWDYPVSQANICCKISAIYLGVSLHLDFQSLAAEAVLLHSFHNFFLLLLWWLLPVSSSEQSLPPVPQGTSIHSGVAALELRYILTPKQELQLGRGGGKGLGLQFFHS